MILNDFTIPKSKYSNEQLDAVLVELCEILLNSKQRNEDFYGWVAAAVIDPTGRLVTGVNYLYGDRRVHAERAAIDKYEAEYGELPKGCIVVTTLSPCSHEFNDNREGESCSDLLNSRGVKLAYCGYKDPTQENKHDKFVTIITENSKIRNLCSKFAHTFLDKGITENELSELFDRSVKHEPTNARTRQRFKTDVDGHEIQVHFNPKGDKLEVDFYVDGRGFALQNNNVENPNKVFSAAVRTILDRLPDAIQYYKPNTVWYKAVGNDKSRVSLYKKLLTVFQRELGSEWKAKTFYNQGWQIYELTHLDKTNEETNKQILSYVKRIHPKGEFNIDHSIMNHAEWELTTVPLSSLHIESDEVSPYDQINWIDYDHVKDITAQDIKSKPIVVDNNGWIIDGNHRAVAARDMGMTSIPAYVPVESDDDQETYDQHMARLRKEKELGENFADGKGPGRPGDSQRHGIPKGATIAQLEKASHSKGRKGQLARWQLNMRRGHKK